jgi:hypothetical protein
MCGDAHMCAEMLINHCIQPTLILTPPSGTSGIGTFSS